MKSLDEYSRRALYDKLKIAIKKLESCKEAIDTDVKERGLEIAGYEVGPGKFSRFWANEQQALVALTQIAGQTGISPDALTELISVSQAEKLLGAKKEIEPLASKVAGKPTVKVKK
jgi:hypothetical protein